jgi:hypothetical protein
MARAERTLIVHVRSYAHSGLWLSKGASALSIFRPACFKQELKIRSRNASGSTEKAILLVHGGFLTCITLDIASSQREGPPTRQ